MKINLKRMLILMAGVIFLLPLVSSCSSSEKKTIVGKWIAPNNPTTYWEFFEDKTAKLTMTLTNLNEKYYPGGKNKESHKGTWWQEGDKYKAVIEMYGTSPGWFIRLAGDTLFIKGVWRGAEEEKFKKEIG